MATFISNSYPPEAKEGPKQQIEWSTSSTTLLPPSEERAKNAGTAIAGSLTSSFFTSIKQSNFD
jgi:hypothetical protein